MFALAVSFQSLKSITWERSQLVQIDRGIQRFQLAAGDREDVDRETLRTSAMEYCLHSLVLESADNRLSLAKYDDVSPIATSCKLKVSSRDTMIGISSAGTDAGAFRNANIGGELSLSDALLSTPKGKRRRHGERPTCTRAGVNCAPPAPSTWRSAPRGRNWSRGNRCARHGAAVGASSSQ
jgi:hypothetical protein